MRAFIGLTLGVLIAIGIGVGVVATTPSSTTTSGSMRTLALPVGLYSRQLSTLPIGIGVVGSTDHNDRCVATTLATSTDTFSKLVESPESHPNSVASVCAIPVAPNVWVLPTYVRGTFNVALRVIAENPRTRRVRSGPVVASISTWGWAHDGEPVASNGSVWLYDDETKPMSVLQLSEVTGRIVRRVPLPGLSFDPVTAADKDGLWIAPSQGWGGNYTKDDAPLYRIAPNASRATVAHRGGSAVQWLVASDHMVWADLISPPPALTETIWRFDGPSAKVGFETPGRLLPGPEGSGTGYAVVGDLTDGLYTLKGTLQAPFEGDACSGKIAVIGINPNTGQQRVIDRFSVHSVTPWVACENESLLAPGQAVVRNDTLLFLFGVTPKSALGFTTVRQLTVGP